MSAIGIATASATETSEPARFERHRGPVTSVAVLPGRRCAVATAYDGAVALFDLESGAVSLLGYHRHLANHVAVNQQGTKAASSSSDYDIYIWDIRSRSLETVLRGHSDDVECFAFVDDQTGVSASRDHRILVWNLVTGAIRRAIDEHEKDVLSVTCWNDCIYSSGDDMTLRQWDLAGGRLVRKWGPFEHETDTCAIDPIHSRAVLGCDDGVIRIFDSRSGRPVREIAAHASGIKKVAVSPVTGDILSAAYDPKIRIWDADSFVRKVEMQPLPSKWERSFNWSPDGASIVAGTFDGTVAVWDAATGDLIQEVGRRAGPAGNACFNEVSASAGGELALVSDDGYIRTVRLTADNSQLLEVVEPASGRTLMNAVSLDEEFGLVVAGAHDHKLHIFDRTPRGLAREREVALGEGPINSVRVAHCPGFAGEVFAACYSGAVVRVRRNGAIAAKLAIHDGAVKALRIHPAEAVGVSCSADGALVSWTLDGTVLQRFPGHTSIVDDVDFDPAGERIASVSRDFTLQVYRLRDGQLLHALTLGRRSPKSVCFWDHQTVVVGDYWGALLRVDLPGCRITRHTIARNGLSSLARTSAGLLATSYDGAVYLVNPADLSVRNVYRAMTQRPGGLTACGSK
ncbi:MAG: WD40 repeat domain-containing protein [Bryobacteraceae bacterium]